MATLEQVEKLRERADVTFEEARAALEAANDDILDAMIILERQGKVKQTDGGEYSGSDTQKRIRDAERDWERAKAAFKEEKHNSRASHENFKSGIKNLGRLLLRLLEIGNSNNFEAIRNGKTVLSCPVTVLVILLIFFFWFVAPLMLIGLFFGWRYRLRGEQLGSEAVNSILEKAENVADELKGSFTERATEEDVEN